MGASPRQSAKVGSKLNRSETVTIRLDPRLNYLTDLAARCQRRTKSSFIEWVIKETLKDLGYGHCEHCGSWLGAPESDAPNPPSPNPSHPEP